MTETNSASPDLAALLSRASVEVSSGGRQLAELSDRFSPGIDVTITFLPGDDCRHNIETAAALRRLGFNPVPHIAAREMRSREALDDFLKRARGEADANRVLLIAGDTWRALGPFKSSMDICASGLIEAHGIRAVSFAGHPEGHPHLDAEQAMAALAAKRDVGSAARASASISCRNSASKARPFSPGSRTLRRTGSTFPCTSVSPVRPRQRRSQSSPCAAGWETR